MSAPGENQGLIPPAKSVDVAEMVSRVMNAVKSASTSPSKSESASGPLFTMLLGEEFSASAGFPSPAQLGAVLNGSLKGASGRWVQLLDETLDNPAAGADSSAYLSQLKDALPLPAARCEFASAVVQWAAARQLQVNFEAILAASLLSAGAGSEVALLDSEPLRTWILRHFCRQAFSLTFDEVLETTFRIANHPVDIVDGYVTRAPHRSGRPALVYLHGKHHNYDPLRYIVAGPGSQVPEQVHPHSLLREALRSTGLVVVGCSGGDPTVTAIVRQALEDGESLPYGMWWCSHQGEGTLNPAVAEMIAAHERAFCLSPGRNVEEVLAQLCSQLGVDSDQQTASWSTAAAGFARSVEGFLEGAHYGVRLFVAEAQGALESHNRESAAAALLLWRQARGQMADMRDVRAAAQAYAAAAELEALYGSPSAARANYSSAMGLYREAGDKHHTADCLRRLGDLLVSDGKSQQARQAFLEAQQLHLELGDDASAARDLKSLGDVCLREEKLHAAEEAYTHAIELHRKIGDTAGAADALTGLGEALLKGGKIAESAKVYREGLELYLKCGDESGAGDALRGLGDVLLRAGKVAEAERTYRRALSLHSKASNELAAADDLKGLADVLLRMDKLDAAERYYREAFELHHRLGDEVWAAYDLNGLGESLLTQGNLEGADNAFRDAMDRHRRAGSDVGAAYDLNGLAEVMLGAGLPDDAAKAYQEALRIHAGAGDYLGAAADLKGLVEASIATSRLADADEYLARVEETLTRGGGTESRLEFEILQSRVAALKGDVQSASRHFADIAERASQAGYAVIARLAKQYATSLLPQAQGQQAAPAGLEAGAPEATVPPSPQPTATEGQAAAPGPAS